MDRPAAEVPQAFLGLGNELPRGLGDQDPLTQTGNGVGLMHRRRGLAGSTGSVYVIELQIGHHAFRMKNARLLGKAGGQHFGIGR
jgi:hypothetical protein